MPDLYLPPLCTIHPWSPEALGPQLNAWNFGMSGITSGSLIIGTGRGWTYPFRLRVPTTIRQLWVYNGSVVSGNFDLGIYDRHGVRLTSSGSVAQAGINALQIVDIADISLGAGSFYMAISADNATMTVMRASTAAQATSLFLGINSLGGIFPLPSTLSIGGHSNPSAQSCMFGLSTRSLI